MRTVAVANSKGGVGKTTVAVHLAHGLALQGARTLLVDLDPQAHATAWFLGLGGGSGPGLAEALLSRRIGEEHLREVEGRPGLSLLPASQTLAAAEHSLSKALGGQLVLRKVLATRARDYDFAVLDCPPALGFYVISALVASDGVLAPVPAAFLSLAGLRQLEEGVTQAREMLEVDTRILGYVLFAADPREAITAEVREALQQQAGDKLLRSEIRVSTAAKALPARQRTALDDGEDERGREDYRALVREVRGRLERPHGKRSER